ncbi:phage tail tape measure protein [Vreelandella venusta]|uniref:phage tail tape measure protein n=1 Tax=Vreelandella venusta TaxID=44935 RepID=UPI0018DAC261|nr:phage tail tape measure protein [Halomonas venusta]QPI62444.1 phage tail tape measure protein [Halomonas venusta]
MSFQSRLELIVDSRSGEQRLRAFEDQLDRAQSSGDRLAKGMGVLKIALGAAAAAAGGFSAGKVITETASFEQSLLKLQVVSGATTTQLAAMESQARTLGATSMFSAKQAADAQNFLAMAGMNVNEVMSATPGILQLATAGQMDLASAADLASNVLGGFRLEVGELNRVNDVLAATAAKSNTSISQLGDALSYAAPIAATAGVSIEQTAAAIGVLSDAGLQSSRAGTGLLGFIRQLSNLTPDATAALGRYGLTSAEVNVEQEGLIAVLDRLQQANINTADSFKIFGSEAGPAAQILASGAVRVNEFTGELELAEGTAERAALVLGSGLEGSFRSLNSAIGESTLQLGRDSGMSAALQEVTNTATGVISVYNGMLPQFREANGLTEDQARNLNTTATAISLTAGAVGGLTSAYVGLTAATWAAHAAQTAFVRIMRVNPIVLAAGAIASLSGALYTARSRTIEFGDTQASVSDWMSGAWQVNAQVFSENWDGAITSVIGLFESMAEPVGGVTSYIWETFKALMTNLGSIVQTTINSIIGYFSTIIDVVGIVTRTMQTLFTSAFDNILSVAGGFWDSVQAVFSGDLSFSAFNSAVDNLKSGFVETMAGAAGEIGSAFRENMGRDYLGEAFDSLSSGAQFVAADFEALGDRISDAAFVARMSRNGFGLVAEGFSEGKTQAQLLQEQLDQLNQSLADPASEDAAKAAKTLADNFESLKRQLDPSYSSLMDFWEGIELLNEAIDTTTIEGMTEYNRLVGLLTERYAEATKGSDDAAKRMKSLTDTYDRAHAKAQQLSTDLAAINEAWRNDPANGDQYARMVASVREEMAELALEADPVAKELARLWEEAGERIDETFADAFAGAFDSFDSFADQLLDGFKRLLGELAYQATLKPIVVGFTQDMQGLLGIGGGSSSGSFGGIGSLISGGKSLLGLGSTAASGTALSGGFMGAAATQSAGSLYGMAATGGVAQAGLASSIAAGISTAMPWIAGGLAIDSLLGGGITKAISGLFGGKSRGPSFDLMTTNQDPRTIFEDVQHGVTATGAFGNVGFHGGNTNRLEETFGSFDNARQYLETIAATDDMMAALSPKDVEAMTYAIQQMRIQSNDAAGITEQLGNRTKAAFGAMSGDFGAFARTLSGSTEEIIAQAQNARQAHELLTGASERLGVQFKATGGYSYEVANGMAAMAGGVQSLESMYSSFYQNYYTEAERTAQKTEDVTAAFAALGFAMPENAAQFRKLVLAQDTSTEAGRAAQVELLRLESAFAQLTPAIEDAGSAADTASEALRMQGQLNRQLLQAQGDTDALRQLEIDALKEIQGWQEAGLVTTQKRIWAIEDEKEAQREAERAQQERIRAIEQEANAWQRAQQQLASFGVSIDSWIDNLRGTDAGLGTPGGQLAAASQAFDEQYAKALSGDQAALGSITQYADRFIEAQKGWSASGEQTVSTIDRVTGMLEKLPDQLTPEQFIVDGIRDVILNELADEIERAIMDSKYTISTLIDFATNTDQLPADLRAILGEQSHRLDSTLNYLVGENQLTSDLERLAIDSTNNLVATVEYITFSQLEEDDKRLALSSSNTMTAVVDYAVRSDLDNASRRLALESSNVYGVMIEYAIERDISKDDRTLALDSINRYTAIVEYVTRSELTAGNRHLALGSLNEYDAIIDYATRNDIAGADRTLAVEKGNWYLANVDYIVGKTLTAENRRLALQSNHNYISVIDQVLGMQLRGDDRRLALQSGNTYETIVDAVLADGISPDVRKFALSKSNSLLATVDGILESNLPDDVRTLALEDSNHFVTTLDAALADGKLSHDERALLDAQSDTIFKRLETGGLKLTDDEWAVINAASGTRRLDLLADVAFNATDLDKLGDIEKNTGDAIDPNTEGMKISIGRHHNPSGLIDMAYNWGTKWADMGAPAFSGSGGGGLDYSPSNGGSSSGSSGGGGNSSTEQLSLNERARLYYQRYPDLQRYYQSNADSFHKKYGGSTYIDFAKWHWLDGPGQTDAIDRYFAKGGVFTNSIVDSPTPFNMGLMGEAGPEAIVPLHMGADGLGIKNYSAPPLPQFPLLNTQDVTQVMRDMQRTIEQKNEQIVELLKEVRGNTGQTRDAVMGVGKDAHQQREQQSYKLDKINRNIKEKVRTP